MPPTPVIRVMRTPDRTAEDTAAGWPCVTLTDGRRGADSELRRRSSRSDGAACCPVRHMWRIVRTQRVPAPCIWLNGHCRRSVTSVRCAAVAAAGAAAAAAMTSGSSCSPLQVPGSQPKAASEADMIEALQLVILERIETRLTALERSDMGRSGAVPGEKDKTPTPATPAAPTPVSPAQSNGLAGRRILVTAPSTYAARLAGQVLARGGRPVCMPTIVTEPLQELEHEKLDAALRSMASATATGAPPAFAYIAFTSRNGIEAFLRRAKVLGLAGDMSSLLRGCTVCALGNDAKMLEQAGIEVGLLPAISSPSGIIDELGRRGETGRGRAILVPVPEVTGVPEPPVVPNFVAGLNKLGMSVHRCVHRVAYLSV